MSMYTSFDTRWCKVKTLPRPQFWNPELSDPSAFPRRAALSRQELFIYDQSLREIEVKTVEELAKVFPEDADRYRLLLHRNSYYVVAQRGEDLRYALRIDKANTVRPVCAFEQDGGSPRITHALTTYQWLKQSLEGSFDAREGVVWEYAFSRDGFAVADLLIAHHHDVNHERIGEDSLLEWAVEEDRADVVEWLLEHGADPGVCVRHREMPLHSALRRENVPMILNLIRHGADLEPFIDDLADLLRDRPRQARSVLRAAIESLGFIPEQLFLDALDENRSLLDILANSDAPIRPYGVSLHMGERMKLPFYVDQYMQRKAGSDDKAVIERVFQREIAPPHDNFAIASFGSYTRGVQIVRYGGSKVSNDDFLSFTTAFCHYFLSFDCGSEALVSRALAWAGTLTNECPASLRFAQDELACRVAGYYRDLDRTTAFTMSEDEKNDRVVDWKECLNTYRAKHGH